MTLYGIKNCDTVKKAIQWLKSQDVEFEFYDLKAKGIDQATLHQWVDQIGWETLINKKGTTWKQLEEKEKNAVKDASTAIQLMCAKTSVIKRPVIVVKGVIEAIGFDSANYAILFKK